MIHVGKLKLDTDEILFNVVKLSDWWVRRSDAPFFTLGRNAYMDGKTEAYFHTARILNPKLMSHFPELYASVLLYLTDHIGEEVHLNHDFAYPSFHIFESDPAFLDYPSNWHKDFPYETLGLKNDTAYSFTVVIEIPSSGAGLEYRDGEEKYLQYNVGDIIIHRGNFLHNIARLKEYFPNEYRITLQGHVIRHNGRLIMYW
jgi:hypothetical protein